MQSNDLNVLSFTISFISLLLTYYLLIYINYARVYDEEIATATRSAREGLSHFDFRNGIQLPFNIRFAKVCLFLFGVLFAQTKRSDRSMP